MRQYLVAAALGLASVGAWADDASYSIALNGSEVTELNFYDSRCNVYYPAPGVPFCNPASLNSYWTGTLRVTVDGTADGVYSGADILTFAAFDYTTNGLNIGSFDFSEPAASVTISGGQIVSVTDSFWSEYENYVFTGTNISFEQGFELDGNEAHHASPVYGTGVLGPVPEPSTWALMGVGLFAVAHRRLKKRA